MSILIFLALIMGLCPHIYPTAIIDDFSQLNATVVSDIVYPETIKDIEHIVYMAKLRHKKIAVAGKRHSQGGHAFSPGAVIIDISHFNKVVNLDLENKIITVQSGITWEQIQNYINPYNLAVKVMQTAEIFTVGGSLSVNAHGRDPRYGPLIQTVRSMRILLASGHIVEASRERNYELFRLVIGGYGLFGIVLEVDIELTDNALYCKESTIISVEDYSQFLTEQVLGREDIGMHYGILSTSPYNLLEEMIVVNYREISPDAVSWRVLRHARKLRPGGSMRLSKNMLRLQRLVPFAHWADWPAIVMREKVPEIICRNNVMRHPTEFLDYRATTHAYALCSYFIPVEAFVSFVRHISTACKLYDIELFAVLTRYIRSDTESCLFYTDKDRIEIVVFTVYPYSWEGVERMRCWVRSNIDCVIACEGVYYLPGNLYPTHQQINTVYPHLSSFFAKKRLYDPQGLFTNYFYLNYGCLG